MRVAVITGASRGLGLALARALAARRWNLVIDARTESTLMRSASELEQMTSVTAIAGDVTDEEHRRELAAAAAALGGMDALVNNAGILGASPPPRLEHYPIDTLQQVYRVNVLAPLRLFQLAASQLDRKAGRVVNITSEAAVVPFAEWGGYGSSKAALEHVSRVLAVEHPHLNVYWVDPGDLNTEMEQQGFPDQDVSDRPHPDVSVPGLLRLIEGSLPSGRYRAQDLAARA
jgi:NAD(P)-dependent dehydrogenase (short-subunit alcohol dehydrogenase family)